MFILGVSLRCADYFCEEDLKSYELTLIDDEDNLGPPPMNLGLSTIVPPRTTVEVARSVLPTKVMLPIAILSSSTMVPP